MTFATVPVRENGQRVTEDWWNSLRTAGSALESLSGGGYIPNTEFSIANNQAATNVTGLVFAGSSYRTAFIDYQVYRTTSTTERVESGVLVANYKTVAAAWYIDNLGGFLGDSGVTFTITASGQVQAASDNMSSGSAYTGKIIFRARTISVES